MDTFELSILLPDQVLLSTEAVKVGSEAVTGSFVVLPHHIDFVTALVPSILFFQEDKEAEPIYVAIDSGILVKQGTSVWASVFQAIRGENLEQLDQTVEREFRQLDEQQKQTQAALTRLETSLIRNMADLGRTYRGF